MFEDGFLDTLVGIFIGVLFCTWLFTFMSPVELPNGCILHEDVIYCEVAE